MSVYKKMGAGYLTRTKDLTLAGVSLARRRRGDVVSPRQRPSDVCLRSKQRFTWAGKVFTWGPTRRVDFWDGLLWDSLKKTRSRINKSLLNFENRRLLRLAKRPIREGPIGVSAPWEPIDENWVGGLE
jgi:hypothetical protein